MSQSQSQVPYLSLQWQILLPSIATQHTTNIYEWCYKSPNAENIYKIRHMHTRLGKSSCLRKENSISTYVETLNENLRKSYNEIYMEL